MSGIATMADAKPPCPRRHVKHGDAVVKLLMLALILATLAGASASAQSYDPDVGTGNIARPSDDPAYAWRAERRGSDFATGAAPRGEAHSPYAAHNAVAPFGTPGSATNGARQSADTRTAAIQACSDMSRKYAEPTWGTMQMHQFRTCMMQHGLQE
jgi:hypothetical protein